MDRTCPFRRKPDSYQPLRSPCHAPFKLTQPDNQENRWDLRDPDGVMIIQELLMVAKTQGRGWVDYKYPNPTTNTLDQKTSYCEYYEGMMIGCGIYKEVD